MKFRDLIFIVAIALVSCDITENQDSLIPASNDLLKALREVMSMPIGSPSGKLNKVVVYGGDSDIVFSTREIYYPIAGNITYHVIRDQNLDTSAVSINYFRAEDMVETTILFPYNNGTPTWQSTREYEYNSEDLLDKIFITSEPIGRRLLAQYVYNSQDQLIQIEYPYGNGLVELTGFDYDEQGRISSEWISAKGQEESKIGYLVYRYNDMGLLEAKESDIIGLSSGERQDAFRYYYDGQGRLALQMEFDPNFGFQQKGSSEFFYNSSNN